MNSFDHLRGVISSSRDGCVSHAQLQLHHHTIDIFKGYWPIHYLVKELRCHLTLEHEWFYLRDRSSIMSLVISGIRLRQCLESPSVMLPCVYSTWCCILYHRYSNSQSLSPYICTPSYSIEHQLWWYCIPWEFHCSYVSLLQISILFRLPLRPPLCIIISICIDQIPFFEPWSHYLFFWHCYEHGYAYLICLPHPYTCHKPIIKKNLP